MFGYNNFQMVRVNIPSTNLGRDMGREVADIKGALCHGFSGREWAQKVEEARMEAMQEMQQAAIARATAEALRKPVAGTPMVQLQAPTPKQQEAAPRGAPVPAKEAPAEPEKKPAPAPAPAPKMPVYCPPQTEKLTMSYNGWGR